MAVRSRDTGLRRGPRGVLAVLAPVAAAVSVFWVPTADAAALPMREAGLDKPDLAMVVTGGSGRTKAVRSDEPCFARLWQLLQPTYTGTERVPDAWEKGRYPPVRITVVWGLTGVGGWPQTNAAPGGDVAVEREDQLFLAGDGTPWVRTDPAPEQEDDDIRWHRAPRADFDRLDRAGLLGGAREGKHGAGGEVEGADEPRGLAHGAWWAVPGLAVGFAAGAGGTRLIRRAAARPGAGPPREEPRQELIDL
ncbi:hypothetical protein [Streptomyces sp. NPDC005374]|uniref:hypothetical protein n=1 Tax=Streptomyces sp. NPDC005374 TaxID=3364713 RepID=UPI0036BD6E67